MCLRELLMSGPRAAAAHLLALLALPALARIEYITTANGKRVTNSEVCFYRSNVFDDASVDLAVTAVLLASALVASRVAPMSAVIVRMVYIVLPSLMVGIACPILSVGRSGA